MSTTTVTEQIRQRVDALDWEALGAQLDEAGHAVTPVLLDPSECETLADLFDDGRFRSTIEMARHRFGEGRYRYFDHPLPETIAALRSSFYPHLAPIANRWSQRAARRAPGLPAATRAAARALPRGGPATPDTADPALRPGRLERAASGPVRRRVLPISGPDGPLAPRRTSTEASSCCSSSAREPRAAPTC